MNKPIPVLFTIPNFITAGSGSAMLNLIRGLDPQKYTPSICVLKKGGRSYDEAKSSGIEIFEAPFTISPRPYSTFPLRAFQASRIFRPHQFKIWHSFHYLDDYAEPVIARMAGTRKWIYTKKNMSWGNGAWNLRTFLAAGIAVQNSSMPDLFFKNFKKPLEVIPPGVDASSFAARDKKNELKKILGLASSDILAGHSAHFVPVKNHPYLIKALADCKAKNIHLVFAGRMGKDAYTEEVKGLAEKLNLGKRVHFLGEVQDMPQFLNSLDFFVFSSLREACPVAVLEAMACGLACVVTDIPGIRDMHVHEKTGFITAASDPRAFSSALDLLAGSESLRRAMGKEASQRILEKFSLEREVKQYGDFYERVLN